MHYHKTGRIANGIDLSKLTNRKLALLRISPPPCAVCFAELFANRVLKFFLASTFAHWSVLVLVTVIHLRKLSLLSLI
jgi:hypothetical protein